MAKSSLGAHHVYLDGLGRDCPPPAELLTMVLSGGGHATGVEHAVTLEVDDL